MKAVLLLATGCGLEVSYVDSRFYCGGGGACPSGQACVSDYCLAEAPADDDAATPGDADASVSDDDAAPGSFDAAPGPVDAMPATPPDAALPPDAMPACELGNVADNFATSATAPFWVAFNELPTSVAETSGRLVITLPANTAGSHFAGYVYRNNTDSREQHIQIELVVPPNPSSAANAFFKVQNGTNFNNEATFILEAGVLYMDTYDAGYNRLSRKSIPYSNTTHRFLALEESGGQVRFLTSADGTTFTVRETQPVPFPFVNARLALGAGTWKSEASPGGVQFDNLGSGPSTNCFGIPE